MQETAPASPAGLKVPYAYLAQQFANPAPILSAIRDLVATGDFTLGAALAEFEAAFAQLVGARFAIGVNSGTDALKLSMIAAGVRYGDEVITAANTFIATVGAISEIGARPVFVDVDDSFCLDVNLLERAITPRTKAIIPVHLTGNVADIERVMFVARQRNIPVVEDACQAICSRRGQKTAGTWGLTGTYSLHPLKFLNIWGDGGVIVTDDEGVDRQLRLLRNHGLADRDNVVMMGYNSRLDTIQAVVAKHLLKDVTSIIERRNANADVYDAALALMPGIKIPSRDPGVTHTFVTYQVLAENRNALVAHCRARGVDVKIHYPVPVYRQPALQSLGYLPGTFPVTDRHASQTISLPVHQYLERAQLDYVVDTIREFHRAS